MAAKQQLVTIDIPKGFNAVQRQAIANEVIQTIRDRAAANKGVRKVGDQFVEVPFPAYTKNYVESVDFRIGGKSRGNVNLRLSGDMLAAMDVLKTEDGKITVGFRAGTEENARAEGNQLGTYGQPTPVQGGAKARPFLGLTKSELDSVLSRFPTPGEGRIGEDALRALGTALLFGQEQHQDERREIIESLLGL